MIVPLLVHGYSPQLEEWADWLLARGFYFASLDVVLHALKNPSSWMQSTAPRMILLTFDDLPQKHIDATPLMNRLKTRFTSYVYTGEYRGQRADLGAARMMANAGWIIGAHTHSHRDLLKLLPAEVEEEINVSRVILEDVLAVPVHDFAVPFGWHDPVSVEACKRLGFRSYRTTEQGLIGPETDPFRLPTRSLHPFEPVAYLEQALAEMGAL